MLVGKGGTHDCVHACVNWGVYGWYGLLHLGGHGVRLQRWIGVMDGGRLVS